MCLGINDSKASFGNWERDCVPFHLGSCRCGLAAPNEISDYTPYLAAHSGVRVPVYKLSFEGQHHIVEVHFHGEAEIDLDVEEVDAFPF